MALQQYEGRGGVVIDRNTYRENCINLQQKRSKGKFKGPYVKSRTT